MVSSYLSSEKNCAEGISAIGGTRNGGCTFMATSSAPCSFASAMAPVTALLDSSEPSVGTRIFLNMDILLVD